MSASSHWDLRVLDGFQLSRLEEPVVIRVRKAAALLTYLALQRNRTARREVLAALLWEDAAPAQARVSLRQALSAIRKIEGAGPSLIEADAHSVRLSGDIAIDADRFETMAEGRCAQRAAAADAYRTDLMAGFVLRDAPAFHEWLAVEQARLRHRAVTLLCDLLEADLVEGGDLNRGAATALRLLSIDPYNELGHRGLMRLYARQGRASLAIQQYRSLAALLRRDLQIAPEAQTVQLYDCLVQRRRQLPGTLPAARPAESIPVGAPQQRSDTAPATPARRIWLTPATPLAVGGRFLKALLVRNAPLRS
ncbi:AfsR/SARP family transcriptional regulator [Allosphingosinicella deserti]|uniref:Bacterial transcriptional activator domain-containing protein n=1 Tax=Allosphingosinicella deserti TaxID=2116704 RepID=A0A2P7QLS6_9SPHN|nr:BTAD domain-containing putative transcriptional regulator [Sphingomonas deserti]PSJ38928.1 hypothetical protein C7I55_16560 [Sphingomonas deserti]